MLRIGSIFATMVAADAVLSVLDWRTCRLLQCVLLLAFLIFLIRRTRRPTQDWLLAAAALLFGLVLLEGGALAIDRPLPKLDDSGMTRMRPVVGWGPGKPGAYHLVKTAGDGRVIYDATATIDAHLNRASRPATGPGTIAFFGDSFMFGDGLNDPETLPQAWADLNKGTIPVANFGYSGWSPAVNLLALQTGLAGASMDKPRRLVLMTATWHMERTGCRGQYTYLPAPKYRLDGGTLVRDGTCAGPVAMAWHNLVKRFATYRLISTRLNDARPGKGDVPVYLAILESFVETAARQGVPTTILFLPDDPAYLAKAGVSEAEIVDALRRTGADVLVDKLPKIADPSLYKFPIDGHPTALANRARAQELQDHLKAVAPDLFAGR